MNKKNWDRDKTNAAYLSEGLLVRIVKPRGLLFVRSEAKRRGIQQRETNSIKKGFALANFSELSILLQYLSKTDQVLPASEVFYGDLVKGLKDRVYVNVGVYYCQLGWLFQDEPYITSGNVQMNLERFVKQKIVRTEDMWRSENGRIRFAPYGCEDDNLLQAICGDNNIAKRVCEASSKIKITRPRDSAANYCYVVSITYDGSININMRDDVGHGYGIGVKLVKSLR